MKKRADSNKSNRPKAISREGSIFSGVSCYVLDNGMRVITKRSMAAALSGNQLKSDTTEPANLDRYIEHLPNGSELLATRQHIEFIQPQGGIAYGSEWMF